MSEKNIPELLAPCGSFESLEAALRAGADAVYIGGKSFSARQNAENFSDEDIEKAVFECHRQGVKIYRAINTLVFDSKLSELAQEIEKCCKLGIDGIISQDLAVCEIVRLACPSYPIHASTQMTVHTADGVREAKLLGFKRVVVSRECSEKTIRELCALDTEIEAFVHGALCMSVSGQCYMSAVIGSRSANRGLCAGACRLPFSAALKTDKNAYDLSLKDLCLADYVEKMSKAGVASLKIEGRMKRPEYVAASTDAYRRVLDGETADIDRLRAVFSRSGFTDGYFTGRLGRDMFGFRQKEDVLAASEVLPSLREIYRKERKRFEISFLVKIKEGEKISVFARDNFGLSAEVRGDIPQKAVNKAADEEFVKKQFSKLGDSIYSLKNISPEIDEELSVSASALNELRRRAVFELDKKRAERFQTWDFDKNILSLNFPKRLNIKPKKLRISAQSVSQLSQTDLSRAELITLPLWEWKNAAESGVDISKIVLSLPRFMPDERKVRQEIEKAAASGFRAAEATNLAHLKTARDMGLEVHGGFGLNITNSLALSALSRLGASDCTLSFEMKAAQINSICDFLPIGIIAYGKLPLMLTANCPIFHAVSDCRKCTGRLVDRKGAEFPVLCRKNQGYFEVLNSEILWLADKLDDFNVDFITLAFTDETPKQAAQTVEAYKKGLGFDGKMTRGLYYRGVL